MTNAMNISEERLEQIYHDLQDAGCICEMSAVLTVLTKDDLEATYQYFVVQYGYALTKGAVERSNWFCGNLVINATQTSIRFVRMALDAILAEKDHRKAAVVEGQAEASN